MVTLIQAVVLSVIQGITEWFPISSSGHLAIFQQYFGFQNLSYDVFLHFASVLAVIVLFRKDIRILFKFDKEKIRYLSFILIGLIPVGLVGFLLRDYIEYFFSSSYYLGIFFIFSGGLIYLTKFSKNYKKDIKLSDSVFVGFFQALAIFPGISRSGITISSSLFRGVSKKSAVRFSFLMSIPLILGASLIEMSNVLNYEIDYFILVLSFVITFLVSLISIKLLLRIIQSDKFYLFGIYNMILGVGVLIV